MHAVATAVASPRMALQDYLATEIAIDHRDGLMTRREALRRLGLLGLGAGVAAAVLAACGDGDEGSAAASSTSSTSASSETTSPSTASEMGEPITFAGPAGTLQGVLAAASTPDGAVLIIHENRGLTDHFKALPSRFAASGYTALAVDLLSREGGTDAFSDDAEATAALGAASPENLLADMRGALDELERRVPDASLAIVGFCFGGGQVWSLLNAGEPRLAAAVPFYGPGPDDADFSSSEAAVLGIYADADSRVNASRDAMEAALTEAGLTHELRTFPGVDHAFFNDTGPRYDVTQADAAYEAVLAWFGEHL